MMRVTILAAGQRLFLDVADAGNGLGDRRHLRRASSPAPMGAGAFCSMIGSPRLPRPPDRRRYASRHRRRDASGAITIAAEAPASRPSRARAARAAAGSASLAPTMKGTRPANAVGRAPRPARRRSSGEQRLDLAGHARDRRRRRRRMSSAQSATRRKASARRRAPGAVKGVGRTGKTPASSRLISRLLL